MMYVPTVLIISHAEIFIMEDSKPFLVLEVGECVDVVSIRWHFQNIGRKGVQGPVLIDNDHHS